MQDLFNNIISIQKLQKEKQMGKQWMIEQENQSENYGYQVPSVLNDPKWRKCFQNESENRLILLEGIIKIRQYLSQETEVNHLIKMVFNSEIHKVLFRYSKRLYEKVSSGESDDDDLTCLHELIWIFTNLCSGSKQLTMTMIELGIISFCKDLFNLYKYERIISILFELVGNLGGQLSLNIKLGFLADPRFYYFMEHCYSNYIGVINFHENATWAFANLFRDFDSCDDKHSIANLQAIILGYYPTIANLLEIDMEEAIINLLHIFSFISKNQNFHMVETFQIIDKFLTDPRDGICKLVVQIMGNYIAECDEAVDYALNHPYFLDKIFTLMNPQQKTPFRKQGAWILSNLFAGSVDQVEKLVSFPTLFNRLYQVLTVEQNEGVLRQLIWSISNSFQSCSQQSFEVIFSSRIIDPLSAKMMSCKEKLSFKVYLQGVYNYLKKFKQNPNLQFGVFQQNLINIDPVISLAESTFGEQSEEILLKTFQIRESAQELISRGPITEEQLAKIYLEKIKF